MYLYYASCVSGDGVPFFLLKAAESREQAFILGKEYREYAERNYLNKKHRPFFGTIEERIKKWRARQ